MKVAEYEQWSAAELAGAVGRREVSAGEVIEAALGRIREADVWLRAFRQVWAERARAAAAAIDREPTARLGRPLLGVPIAVKHGGTAYVGPLVAAGAIPIGTTATPGPGTAWQTWGQTDRGPTLNPWNRDVVPGGSSAGSAVAVAASMVPLATGTDGAGSIRIPAAWCAVPGLKPTNGSIPTADRTGLAVGGAIARNLDDLRLYLSVMTGTDAQPPPILRVTWSPDLGFADTDPEVASIARTALMKLLAHDTFEAVEVPVEIRDPAAAWMLVRAGRADGTGVRQANDDRLREVFAVVDVIATPTTPNLPHGHDGPGDVLSVALTWAFNLSGHPAVSLPAGFARSGLPVGLQLVARHREEDRLLAALGRSAHACSSGSRIR
ncbi:amidase [Kribbella sp. CA-247076]|uniref:amidase n=1 Tax=Kribbella sp. CA-247076 TaxID=3239941 RepID=UPI003D907A76